MPLFRSLVLILLASANVHAQDWPMYLRDLAHSSFNNTETQLDVKRLSTLEPAWTHSTGATLASAPTLSGGVLYFGDWDGFMNAVDAQRGSLIWRKFIGKAANPSDPTCLPGIGVSSQAVVAGNTVYAGGGDSAVYALDKSNGAQLWRVPLADPATGSYIWSGIAPYQNALYLGIASLGDCPVVRGAIVRIDPQNPQQPRIRYFVPAGETGAGLWSTPAIDADANAIFVTTANGYEQNVDKGFWTGAFMKLDPNTFETKSYYLLPEADSNSDLVGGSSPALFTPPGGMPLAAASAKNGMMYAIRRSDSSLAWKLRLAVSCTDPEDGCGSLSTPSFDGKTLFAGAGVRDPDEFYGGSVYAINPADGSVIWVRDTGTAVIAATTIANGMLFVSTSDGLEVYDCATGQHIWSDNKRAALFSQPVVANGTIYSTYVSGELVAWTIPAANPTTLYSYSAASGLPSLAPGAIAAAYASNMNATSVTIADSKGNKLTADLLYSSPGQVNFVVPEGVAPGRATVTAASANGTVTKGTMQISDVAPGIFSANSDGKGVAAAQAMLVRSDGTTANSAVFQCGSAPGSCISTPIDLGTGNDQAYLILYGTGFRARTSLERVTCMIGGVPAQVLYSGRQAGFKGLDQLNVRIPASLKKRGEVEVVLSVDGQLANTVKIAIQ